MEQRGNRATDGLRGTSSSRMRGWATVLGLALVLATAAASASPAAALDVGGVLLLPGGEPCSAARVELAPLPDNHAWAAGILAGRPESEAVAGIAPNPDGRFHLRSPGGGVWSLRVRALGRVPMRRAPLVLAESLVVPPVTLRPDRGARIRVENADGSVAPGVWVYAGSATPKLWQESRAAGWRPAARIARTDARGEAVLPRAEGERLVVHAFRPGTLDAARAEGDGRIVVRLPEPGRQRTLRVVAGDEEPRPGVVVAFGDQVWPIGRTGDDGRLTLRLPHEADGRIHLLGADGGRSSLALPEEPAPHGAGAGEGDLVLRLDPPHRFTGRVLDRATGRALPHALVWPAYDPGRFTWSDRIGSYSLPASSAGRSRVSALAPGRLQDDVVVDGAAPEGHEVPTMALAADAELTGRVVAADGTPLTGAIVQAAQRDGTVLGLALSEAGGRFSVHGLPPGRVVDVAAGLWGYVSAERQGVGTSTRDVKLVLPRRRMGFGRVLDSGEKPLAEALVTARAGARANAAPGDATKVRTGPDGRYELPLPGAPVDLVVTAAGFAPLQVRGIEVPAGPGRVALGTVVLAPAVAFEGRLVDLGGGPVPGGRVQVLADDGTSVRAQAERLERSPVAARSDEAGQVRVEDLDPGRRYLLRIAADGFLPRRLTGIQAPAAEILLIELHPAARLTGRVVDEDGEPVAAAEITVRDPEPAPGTVGLGGSVRRPVQVETGEDGRFAVGSLTPGPLEIAVEATGFVRSEQLEKMVSSGRNPEVLVTLRRGAVVTGRVTDQDGEAVAGVRLRAGRVRGTSDAEGRFRLAGVEPGRRMLVARHLEYDEATREVDVVAGENRFDLVLSAGSAVAGVVVDEDGAPVPAAHLSLLCDPSDDAARVYQAVSAADGSFGLRGVVDGSYDLEIEADGYAPLSRPRAVQIEGEPVTGLRLVLTPGTAVEGRLVGLDFEEIAAARIEADDGHLQRAGRIDYQGRYRIADLGPGVWRLRAWAPGDRGAEASVAVETGDREVHRDLRFGGVTLDGRVTHGGDPLAEAKIVLSGEDVADRRSATTDWEGRFEIADVEPGHYLLSVSSAREMLVHTQEVDLLGDRALAVEIATTSLSGRVVSAADGTPLHDCIVALRSEIAGSGATGSATTVGTDRQGSFRVGRLSAGSYHLGVQCDGYTPYEQALGIEAGEPLEGLELPLEPAEGLELRLHAATGPPTVAWVNVTSPAGAPVLAGAYPVSPSGHLSIKSLPSGRWRLRLAGPGDAVLSALVTVPGAPVDLVLTREAGLAVEVPALLEENRTGTLTLRGPDGEAFVGVDPGGASRTAWPLAGGAGTVEGLPAGTWGLTVTSVDGRVWTSTVVVPSGTTTPVSLP